ncbi:hypothetical protein EON65_10035 [archaeon]|nr:MAG: hypothetical protein EON65_10035 [archaeon]
MVLFGESTQAGIKKILVGGTDKLPMDFEKQLKFVDSDVLKQARIEQLKVADTEALDREGKVRTLMGKTGTVELTSSVDMNENKMDDTLMQQSSLINPSEDRDEIYNLDKRDRDDRPANSRAGEKRGEFEERRAHNSKYNTYLQQSHAERELKSLAYTRLRALDKGAVDFADPYGVNLGMDRGLREPNLPLPPVTEPLYLLSNTLNNQGTGGVAKLQVDENRLMQKKYKSVASTQAEVRDVSMELTIEQLKSIVVSHKVGSHHDTHCNAYSLFFFIPLNFPGH